MASEEDTLVPASSPLINGWDADMVPDSQTSNANHVNGVNGIVDTIEDEDNNMQDSDQVSFDDDVKIDTKDEVNGIHEDEGIDVAEAEEDEYEDEEPIDPEEAFLLGMKDRKTLNIQVLPGATPTAASYEISNEDHTLGNALRFVIMKNPDVEFCGYSIPHPSEPQMNIRIQTYQDAQPIVTAHSVLDKGLDDLMDLCDIMLEDIGSELVRFEREGPDEDLLEDGNG